MPVSIFNRLPPRGKVYRYQHLIFWAQGGWVCVEDESQDGDFRNLHSAEFAARLVVFRAMLKRHVFNYPDERLAAENFVTNGTACVNEAYKQGDPSDPKIFEELKADRKRSIFYTGTGVAMPTKQEIAAAQKPLKKTPAVVDARFRPEQNKILPVFRGTKK